jgi:hypothetical protein
MICFVDGMEFYLHYNYYTLNLQKSKKIEMIGLLNVSYRRIENILPDKSIREAGPLQPLIRAAGPGQAT